MRRRVQAIPAAVPLRQLIPRLRAGEVLGVWISPANRSRPNAIYRSARLLVSADLGALLGRVERVLVWDGSGFRTLPVGRRGAG
jgi:hypothetical protein